MWPHNSLRWRGVRRSAAVLLAILICLPALVPASSAQPVNGAGLVVRHGDGTLIYAYVQFEEESISGMDLLTRSGLDLTVTPYGGLGTGVCRIDGEGCPADNCYCESYDSPAEYWQYYGYENGSWARQAKGPTSRQVEDGDIDGWTWTAGEHGLPATTIDEIAALNGVDRSPPTPTLPPPTPTPVPPTPTFTPVPPTVTATQPPPMSTPVPTSTVPPTPTETPTVAATSPPSADISGTEPEISPTSTAVPTVTSTRTLTATATKTVTPTRSSTPALSPTLAASAAVTATASPTGTAAATSVAVIVTPGGTPQPLETAAPADQGDSNDYLLFGVVLAATVAGGGVLVVRNQRRRSA